MATDDELQDSNLGTTKGCHLKEIPVPPTPGPVVMVMTMTVNIWGMFLIRCKWRGDYHPYMMTRVIHTWACTHTILTQTPNIESGMRQTEAMAVSLNLTNLSHWLPRGISSFNNRERKRQRYQKGKKKSINIQFHTNLLLLPNKCWDDNSFIPFWKKNKNKQKKPKRHIQSNNLYIHLKSV